MGCHADVGGYAYRVLTWSPLRWVGTVSYGIYLWHEPFAHFMAMTFTAWIALPLTFAAALAVATLSWRCIEMPLRSRAATPSRDCLGQKSRTQRIRTEHLNTRRGRLALDPRTAK